MRLERQGLPAADVRSALDQDAPRVRNGRRPAFGAVRIPNELLDEVEAQYCELAGVGRGSRRPAGFGAYVAELIAYAHAQVQAGKVSVSFERVVVDRRPRVG